MVRIEPLEQLDHVRAGDDQLAQGAHIADRDGFADRPVLGERITVDRGAFPRAGPVHPRAPIEMAIVQHRPLLDRVVRPRRGFFHRQPPRRRPRRRRCAHRPGWRAAQDERPEMGVAQQSLARAHRDRRVPLEQLRPAVPLVPGGRQLLRRHILAGAHDAAGRGRAHPRHGGHRCRLRPLGRRLATRRCSLHRAPRLHDISRAIHDRHRRLAKQAIAWDEPKRHDERVTGNDCAPRRALDDHRAETAAAPRLHYDTVHRHRRAWRQLRGPPHGLEMRDRLRRRGHHDRGCSRGKTMHARHARGPATQPHAREIVARKDRMLLHRARRDDDAPRMDPMHGIVGRRDHQWTIVHADHSRPFEDRHAALGARGRQQLIDR